MSKALATLGTTMGERFGLNAEPDEIVSVLKSTAFKGNASDAQLVALLIVAQQYGLNPFTKEIYAFPDRQNGIVPVVGVDGWSRIINSDPNFDGMDFQQDDGSCTCIIYRKDRSHPIKVTEWMSECKRANVGPWQSHPKRMLRHKAMIQCSRLAFGFVGIYDQDEAERIVDGEYRVVSSGKASDALARIVPEDTPERIELIADLEKVAKSGTDAFRAHWPTLTKDQRQMVADKLDDFKRTAEAADSDMQEAAA